jgi:hypothetical protein
MAKKRIYDYGSVKIEKGIPFPEDSMAGQAAKVVSKLDIGDSFTIAKPQMYHYLAAMAKKSGMQLKLRNTGTSTHAEYRVWRMK